MQAMAPAVVSALFRQARKMLTERVRGADGHLVDEILEMVMASSVTSVWLHTTWPEVQGMLSTSDTGLYLMALTNGAVGLDEVEGIAWMMAPGYATTAWNREIVLTEIGALRTPRELGITGPDTRIAHRKIMARREAVRQVGGINLLKPTGSSTFCRAATAEWFSSPERTWSHLWHPQGSGPFRLVCDAGWIPRVVRAHGTALGLDRCGAGIAETEFDEVTRDCLGVSLAIGDPAAMSGWSWLPGRPPPQTSHGVGWSVREDSDY